MAASNLPSLPPEKGEWDEEAISRRKFLEGSFAVAAGLGMVVVGVPSARFLVGNSFEAPTAQWVELGNVADFSPDGVTRVNYSTKGTDAWREVTKRGTVYVYSADSGSTFTALDGTCTHLGCIVQWHEDQGQYICPCHSGYFTKEGKVISGPPPKPMRQLPVKTENGVLYAQV